MSCFSCNKNECSPFNPREIDLCAITREEYRCQALKLWNLGPLWTCIIGNCCQEEENKSKFRKLIDCIIDVFFDVRLFVCELSLQANPCTATCEDAINDWASLYCLQTCELNEPITQELICEFFENRNNFNCEWISRIIEIETGRTVLECEQLCVNCDPCCNGDSFADMFLQKACIKTISTPPTCSTVENGTLYFPTPSGTIYESYNGICERQFANNPCVKCCETDAAENFNPIRKDPCDFERNLGGCSCPSPQNGCNSFASYENVLTSVPMYQNPSTLNIKISGSNPCSNGDAFNDLFVKNSFKSCLLEKIAPLHLCFNYEFEC